MTRRLLHVFCLLQIVAARQYEYLTYAKMLESLRHIAIEHSDIVQLYSANEQFALPTVGQCRTSKGLQDCHVWVLEIGSDDVTAPEVFLSGTIHGDERVGPTALVGLAEYLLSHRHEKWADLLLRTRHITMMPVANAIGFEEGRRLEGGVDPNRDFAFDTEPHLCMRTIAARAINEVWRRHLFQLAVTFHGGDSLVAYPWGDTSHCEGYPRKCSGGWVADGDSLGMEALGNRLADATGSLYGRYVVGPMNEVIYPVKGGMEDWAYGGSWHSLSVQCTPTTHGGYSADRTLYDNATLRAVNILVETAKAKQPPQHTLGTDEDVLTVGGAGDGHVPRNIRLALALIDVAAVLITPLRVSVTSDHTVDPPALTGTLGWFVSGAFEVNESWLECTPALTACDRAVITSRLSNQTPPVAVFEGTLVAPLPLSESIHVRVCTIVDQGLASPLSQSHWVNARTRDDWNMTSQSGSKRVIGKVVTCSELFPVFEIGKDYVSNAKNSAGEADLLTWQKTAIGRWDQGVRVHWLGVSNNTTEHERDARVEWDDGWDMAGWRTPTVAIILFGFATVASCVQAASRRRERSHELHTELQNV